ncbi:MAG: bifunctional pyr operon transcriptional regulator/uracil phosphoribosyltransferase PyrR [Ferrimicrobium sp.]
MSAFVLDGADVGRILRRIGHEILERNRGTDDLVLVGVRTGGVWIADRLRANIADFSGGIVPCVEIDASAFRDDVSTRGSTAGLGIEIDDKVVILVDDVLHTGRTVRAALDALSSCGRPRLVELAVMVDRGLRELPIRADFVGKNLPSRRDEYVRVSSEGVVIEGPNHG